MQYCSLQHLTLLLSPVISTTYLIHCLRCTVSCKNIVYSWHAMENSYYLKPLPQSNFRMRGGLSSWLTAVQCLSCSGLVSGNPPHGSLWPLSLPWSQLKCSFSNLKYQDFKLTYLLVLLNEEVIFPR